ncbi:MAG: metalloregulator ArsR/SmtB family transcription factor [Bacteroidota bacterium]|nr:metalloregulator ArsR/SmtB family transcription factor [Bacteroidota bacterium]
MQAETLEKAAFILKTIAHPTRLAIIDVLHKHGQLPVNDVCRLLNAEQSIISHHLINMKIKGLLTATKSGNQVYYSLKELKLLQIIDCVTNCNCNM